MPPKAGELDELMAENALLKETVERQEAQILALTEQMEALMKDKEKEKPEVQPEVQPEVKSDASSKERRPTLDEKMRNKVAVIRRNMKAGKLSRDAYVFLKNELPPTCLSATNLVTLFRETYCPAIGHEVKTDVDYAGMLEEMKQILKI